MKAKLLVASAAIGIGFASSAFSACTNYTDALGNASIRCSDGRSGYLYKDQFGNTTGQISGERVNAYRDSSGQTSMRIGDERLSLSSDQRNALGRAGDSRINPNPGSVDGRVNCYRDTFGMSTCR